jgi:hypothetical protein
VVLETNNQEQLIFKHAISTVVMARMVHAERHLDSRPIVETAAPTQAITAASVSEE